MTTRQANDGLNPIQREAILKERIKRENENMTFRRDFSTNPQSLQRNFVTEKFYTRTQAPSTLKNYDVSESDDEKQADDVPEVPEISEEDRKLAETTLKKQLQEDLERFDLGPKEKYAFPQTRAQEYGWFNDLDEFKNDPVFNPNHNLSQCDVTLYAQAHIQSKGINPFLAGKGAGGALKS